MTDPRVIATTLLFSLALAIGVAPAGAGDAGEAGTERGRFPGLSVSSLIAYERREERLRDTLRALSGSAAPFAEKRRVYIAALRAAYGERAFGPRAPHLTRNLIRFLELDSVQRDLLAMTVVQRRAHLREFRAALGLEEAALARWDALDLERDAARFTGEVYMAERAKLERLAPGPAREAQRQALRERLFGPAEAVFIRQEEATGFHRFRVPQVLGVN